VNTLSASWYDYDGFWKNKSMRSDAFPLLFNDKDYTCLPLAVVNKKNIIILNCLGNDSDGYSAPHDGLESLLFKGIHIYNLLPKARKKEILDSIRLSFFKKGGTENLYYFTSDKYDLEKSFKRINSMNFLVDTIYEIHSKLMHVDDFGYLFKIKPISTDSFSIKTICLKSDSVYKNYNYKSGLPSTLQTFIVQHPGMVKGYWKAPNDSLKIKINETFISSKILDSKNRIIRSKSINNFKFSNYNNMAFFLFIQEINNIRK
jgi:hypothetical protein